VRAKSIHQFSDFKKAEEEVLFLEKYHIRPLFLNDKAYPNRLRYCNDAPVLLYYKGSANLNTSKIISVVGTRYASEYGKQLTEQFIKELQAASVTVVSGLAVGIDALAHKTALRNNLPTIAVLAHGFKFIYPPQHKSLAKEILQQGGGLLTEFIHSAKPEKYFFPKRNRIVAGISDATIVIETAIKGGSMITGRLAESYNRDVFAFPGRTTDVKSAGCNFLIRTHTAELINTAAEFLELMGWNKTNALPKAVQQNLFANINEDERKLVTLLQQKGTLHIDEIASFALLSNSSIAASILNLELQGIIKSLPGKRYTLL
jgi:DNA processing protein